MFGRPREPPRGASRGPVALPGGRAAAVVRGSGHNGRVSTTSLPASTRTPRLREALLAADFTADGLLERLGAPAYAALARSETVPALRATREDSPLDTLVRLFLLQRPVPAAAAPPLFRWRSARRTAGWSGGRTTWSGRPSTYGRTAAPRARTGSSCPTWGVRSAAPEASARTRRASSSASAGRPPRWPGSPSESPSNPLSTSGRAPASRRCTPHSTPTGSPPRTSTRVLWSSPGSPSPCPAPPRPISGRAPCSNPSAT